MSRAFRAIGISYKNTSLAVREALTFDESQARKFLLQLKEVLGVEEAMVLSTCNRTEIYFLGDQIKESEVAALVDTFHGYSNFMKQNFETFEEQEAIQHLFEVSLGVDSMVLGDIQITNQVKKAYQWSADEQMAGPFLHRLLHTIFFTNKRVVQETPFRDGTASVASAAVEITTQYLQNYTSPKVMVVGLGEIGANVAENLSGHDLEVTLVNRTLSKAEEMANKLGYQVAAFEDLDQYVSQQHVIISAVRSEQPIFRSDNLTDIKTPKLMIDLSVPRSIDANVEEIPGLLLYNIDHLEAKTNKARERRAEAIPEVQKIIQESIDEFNNWSQEMEVSPVIKQLKQALEELRQQELARYLKKANEQEAKMLDKVTKGLIQKVIKLPVLQLKAACKRGEAENLAEVLTDLFDLEKSRDKVSK